MEEDAYSLDEGENEDQVDKTKLAAGFETFIRKLYYEQLLKAAEEEWGAVQINFKEMDEFSAELADVLLNKHETFFEIAGKALDQMQLAKKPDIRIFNLPSVVAIRDLRSKHIGKFVSVEGIVRKASEIRPEITENIWECPECKAEIIQERKGNFIGFPNICDCGNKKGFKQKTKKMIDTRWIVIEEPFELTEGERPSQVTIFLKQGLVSPEGRRITEPGNRLKITGVLMDVPKNKAYSVKLDFYLDANHVVPTEIGWSKLEVTKEDEAEIKRLAADTAIYKTFVESLAPSIYGLEDIKESIILQLFGGVPRTLKDGTKLRGDIHLLLLGDPSSGKSQLLKLVPQIVPRGKYVSGKGASVKADEPVIIRNSHEIKIVPFGEYASQFYKPDEDGFSIPDRNIETLSLNLSTLKFEWKLVKSVYRHRTGEDLLKFELETGREITVTDDHSIFTIENGKIVCKQASLLMAGDTVIVPAVVPVKDPVDMGEEMARLLGYFIAEGHVHYGKGSYKIEFTLGKNDGEIIADIGKISGSLFGKEAAQRPHGKNGIRLSISGKEAFLRLKELLGDVFGKKAKEKTIPNIIFNSSENCRKAFVEAYMKGDKGVTKSKKLMSGLLYLLLEDRQIGSCNKRDDSGVRIIEGHVINASGKRYDLKAPHPDKSFTNHYKNIPLIACPPLLRKYFLKKISNSKYGHANLERLSNRLLLERLAFVGGRTIETKEMKNRFGPKIKQYMATKKPLFKKDRVGKNWFVSLSEEGRNIMDQYGQFEKLCQSDMGFARIKSISKEKSDGGFVYDFSVEGENFVSGFGGILCHNTGVGLTATVSKDEQFMGGWVLEAGAMVLAHKGLLAVDEFEKMAVEDQVAMHEALEQGSVSIAKASIVATLPAQTSVLAGGNPKFSRFDPYLPIAKQITIPDTLLSRFDLKFILKDIPSVDTDTKITEHVLKSREDDYENIKPKLEAGFIRKYIAYAKGRCVPRMPKEVGTMLKKFYVDQRRRAEGGQAPIPITLRQFEALIRLSEASAKVQLSDIVRKEDAERAIKLMKYSLRQLGMDPETGLIDIDRTEGSTPASERSQIRVILDIIGQLSEKKREVLVKEIIEGALKQGVNNSEEIIDKLKREGMLFEPSPGHVQKI